MMRMRLICWGLCGLSLAALGCGSKKESKPSKAAQTSSTEPTLATHENEAVAAPISSEPAVQTDKPPENNETVKDSKVEFKADPEGVTKIRKLLPALPKDQLNLWAVVKNGASKKEWTTVKDAVGKASDASKRHLDFVAADATATYFLADASDAQRAAAESLAKAHDTAVDTAKFGNPAFPDYDDKVSEIPKGLANAAMGVMRRTTNYMVMVKRRQLELSAQQVERDEAKARESDDFYITLHGRSPRETLARKVVETRNGIISLYLKCATLESKPTESRCLRNAFGEIGKTPRRLGGWTGRTYSLTDYHGTPLTWTTSPEPLEPPARGKPIFIDLRQEMQSRHLATIENHDLYAVLHKRDVDDVPMGLQFVEVDRQTGNASGVWDMDLPSPNDGCWMDYQGALFAVRRQKSVSLFVGSILRCRDGDSSSTDAGPLYVEAIRCAFRGKKRKDGKLDAWVCFGHKDAQITGIDQYDFSFLSRL